MLDAGTVGSCENDTLGNKRSALQTALRTACFTFKIKLECPFKESHNIMSSVDRRAALGLGLAGLAVPSFAADDRAISAPPLGHVATVRINVAQAQEQGMIDSKRKRFIPITGGTISGSRMNGIVLSGGGDWQAIHEDGLTEIFARYSLKTDDGITIGITNPGVRVASPDVVRRIAAGEDVPPSQYYFRSTPTFDVTDGTYAWLRRKVFVGCGIRRPDHVLLEIFEVG